MKEEKVRIKVRLTEEEKEKLERNSALCGLTQSGYVRQLCRGVHPKPKPPDVFWQLMDELYKAHSDLKECAKYEPSALEFCTEIERLVLDEPVNGLDPLGIQELRALIRSFPQKGITVIISSHILSEIQQTADYIGIIAKGTVGFEGKLQEQQDLEALFMKVVAKGGNES